MAFAVVVVIIIVVVIVVVVIAVVFKLETTEGLFFSKSSPWAVAGQHLGNLSIQAHILNI